VTCVRRSILVVALLVAALAGGTGVVARAIFGSGSYAQVVSITGTTEYHDPALLERAWRLPVAAEYHSHGGIESQHNPSFCGPASLVNLFHSLGIDANQSHILDGSNVQTHFGFILGGLTLDQEAEIARAKTSRQEIEILRDLSLEDFRRELAHTNDRGYRYLVNFHRGPLFGRGGGHHSPILGYLTEDDLVFVGDVNGNYGPWLVKSERLFHAIDTVDSSSGKKRGLVRLQRRQ
jgi:hypothetical protein